VLTVAKERAFINALFLGLDGPKSRPLRAYASNAVSEFSDDIIELIGIGYWLKTGLGLRRDIAPLVRNRAA